MLWLEALFPSIRTEVTFSQPSNVPMLEFSCRACREASLFWMILHVSALLGPLTRSCEERNAMSSSANATVPSPNSSEEIR